MRATSLFITSLLSIYSEEFFKEAGQVVNVTFVMSPYEDPPRFFGLCVVEFATVGEAQKVLIVSFFFFLLMMKAI